MPRKRKKPESAQVLAERLDLPTADQIPNPDLPTFTQRVEPSSPSRPIPPYENKTIRHFTGRVASGRGVTVTADDTSFAIQSDHPLSAGQIALAQRNGFDDYSEGQDGRIMVADKAEMRRVGGDVNWVARSVTGPESGRSR